MEMFLGLLYPTEEYNVYMSAHSQCIHHVAAHHAQVVADHIFLSIQPSYGYVTNTKIKFVVVTTDDFQENAARIVHIPHSNQHKSTTT